MIEFQQRVREVLHGVLNEEDVRTVLRLAYEDLEYAVGRRIVSTLDDTQLSAFEAIFDAHDDDAALVFISEHVPGVSQVVAEEFDVILLRLSAFAASLEGVEAASV